MLTRRNAWLVAIAATLTMTVSYVDRSTLSILAPEVTRALHLSNEDYGWLTSAFSLAYLIGTPLAGWWIDRAGVRRGLFVSVLAWSAVAALHALVPGFAVLFALRIALGITEGPGFPGAAQTVQRILPAGDRERGFGVLFTGSSLGTSLVPLISVKWFGARGNNQGDDTAAINRAIAFANALSSAFTGITIFFPAGTYIISAGLTTISAGLTTISANYVHVRGAGANATQINLAPTATTYVFVFCGTGSPPAVQALCSISGLGFYSADTTYHKTAILCINASDMVIEDIVVSPPWTGNTSIGLQTQGREAIRARNLTISADRPISIERNPGAGTLGGNTIDCDHFHFSDLYLLPSPTECCMAFVGDSTHGINLTDFTLDGYNAFAGGENGIFFSDPPGNTLVGTCLSFHVQNVRREQTTSGGTGAGNNGFTIYINAVNRRFQNILIQNVHADNTAKGFFFRNANNVTLQNCIYDGSSSFNSCPTALDADSTCWDIALQNTMFQVGSTINTNGLQEVLSLERYGTQISPFVYFTTTSNPALPGIKLGGAVRIITGSGAPTSSEPSGSLYLNQTGGTGTPPTAWLYVREGSSWVAK